MCPSPHIPHPNPYLYPYPYPITRLPSSFLLRQTNPLHLQAPTKRAGRKAKAKDTTSAAAAAPSGKGQKVKKATYETTKKKEVGVSDLTLISKITNEAINENLKKRFENAEIYVGGLVIRWLDWVMLDWADVRMCCGRQTYIGHVLISVNPFKDCMSPPSEGRIRLDYG